MSMAAAQPGQTTYTSGVVYVGDSESLAVNISYSSSTNQVQWTAQYYADAAGTQPLYFYQESSGPPTGDWQVWRPHLGAFVQVTVQVSAISSGDSLRYSFTKSRVPLYAGTQDDPRLSISGLASTVYGISVADSLAPADVSQTGITSVAANANTTLANLPGGIILRRVSYQGNGSLAGVTSIGLGGASGLTAENSPGTNQIIWQPPNGRYVSSAVALTLYASSAVSVSWQYEYTTL